MVSCCLGPQLLWQPGWLITNSKDSLTWSSKLPWRLPGPYESHPTKLNPLRSSPHLSDILTETPTQTFHTPVNTNSNTLGTHPNVVTHSCSLSQTHTHTHMHTQAATSFRQREAEKEESLPMASGGLKHQMIGTTRGHEDVLMYWRLNEPASRLEGQHSEWRGEEEGKREVGMVFTLWVYNRLMGIII